MVGSMDQGWLLLQWLLIIA